MHVRQNKNKRNNDLRNPSNNKMGIVRTELKTSSNGRNESVVKSSGNDNKISEENKGTDKLGGSGDLKSKSLAGSASKSSFSETEVTEMSRNSRSHSIGKFNSANLTSDSIENEIALVISITKDSSEEEVKNHYMNVDFPIEKKLSAIFSERKKHGQGQIQLLSGDPEVKGLVSQLKKDFVAIMLYHPNMARSLGSNKNGNLHEVLWKMCFYEQISELKSAFSKVSEADPKSKNRKKLISAVYLQFLSKSRDFFKSLVERLEKLANSINTAVKSNEPIEEYLLKALYDCIIHQGDIERYKESVVNSKFTESEGFYVRATELDPNQGHGFNQLATISIYQKRYLIAANFFVRAIEVEVPAASAEGNLKLLLKKHILETPDASKKALMDGISLSQGAEVDAIRSKVTNGTVFIIAYVIAKLINDRPVSESDLKNMKLGLGKSLRWKLLSKSICISIVVLLVYLFETKPSVTAKKIAHVVDIFVNVCFKQLKEDKDEFSLLFLSLMSDFLQTEENSKLTSIFSSEYWDLGVIAELASKAPLTALTARCPLPEEKTLEGFKPLKTVHGRFIDKRGMNPVIKERDTASYRANKIANVCVMMQEFTKVEIANSQVDEVTSQNDDEILLQPEEDNDVCVEKNTTFDPIAVHQRNQSYTMTVSGTNSGFSQGSKEMEIDFNSHFSPTRTTSGLALEAITSSAANEMQIDGFNFEAGLVTGYDQEFDDEVSKRFFSTLQKSKIINANAQKIDQDVNAIEMNYGKPPGFDFS